MLSCSAVREGYQELTEDNDMKRLSAILVGAIAMVLILTPLAWAQDNSWAATPLQMERGAAAAASLAGTSWTLTSLGGKTATGPVITANFQEDGRLVGSGGCNRYTAAYKVTGDKIAIGPAASTMMACPQPVMAQEAAYLKALEQSATFKVDAAQLTLLDAGGKPLATFAPQSMDLAGTMWEVLNYNNGKEAVVSVTLGTHLTADFGTDGKLSGSGGCNTYGADYKTESKKITIGPIVTTRMMCAQPAGVMDQEAQYLAALESAATYSIDGDKLEMRTAADAMAALFQRVRPPAAASLAGTSWTLTSLGGKTPAGPVITANFQEDGSLVGSGGCNRYNAAYKVSGDKIAIGPAASTMMACPQPVMAQEAAYLKALEQAATFKADAAQLTLFDAGGKPLATFAPQNSGLAGTMWEVLNYNNGKQAVVGMIAGTHLTAGFGADGKLSGSGGCNDYGADYKTEGKNITIGPIMTTRKMCAQPAGVMDQEAQYLAALESAATYSIDGDRLEMRTAADAMAALFQRVR
jgi:heat shock protein HslJ